MTIRARLVADTQAFTDWENILADFGMVMGAIAGDTFKAIEPHILDELRYEPPSVHYPFVWTTEKQRRAYWATDGFGAGIPYKRTHRYSQAWKLDLLRDGDTFTFRVSNDDPKAKWVGGSFDRRREFQQPGHVASGWPKSLETVDFWLEAAGDEFQKAFDRMIDSTFGGLTLTRRNR